MNEQRCVMKFFFLQGKRYAAIDGVVGETTVGLATVEHCCQRFKADNFFTRQLSAPIGGVVSISVMSGAVHKHF
jgi:hypothetical protein